MNPIRTCTAIIGLAESFQAHFATYQATEAALAPALLNAANSTPGGRSSDHSDPTANRAAALTTSNSTQVSSYPDACHALEQALAWLRLAQERQSWVIRQHPDIARQADAAIRALRCDGSVDPLCTRSAVKGGICWACIKRRQRESDPMVDMSTAYVVETVAYEPRPVEPMAPMRLTTVWCHFCGVDYDVTGFEPTAWLLSHQANNCV